MKAFHPAGAPQLPGFSAPKTYAAHPVWKDSARSDVKFSPMSKRQAVKAWHDLRQLDRTTRSFNRQGVVGRCGLMVAQALLFDCLNYASGRLDPSYATIARLAGVSISSVTRSLRKLKELGVINWVRRCIEEYQDGRYVLGQISNAYGISPSSSWRGFWKPPPAPAPHPSSWGASPPLPSKLGLVDALAVLDAAREKLDGRRRP
jgi:hypothetical protein